MATPTPDMVGIYYASQGLDANGNPVERLVGGESTAMQFSVQNIEESTGFWDGTLGFFTNTTTAALRGRTFHVRSWNKENESLTIASPLPAVPVSGDKFVLFARGGKASTMPVLCMQLSGKQPEIEPVTGTTVTGVTIKKVSPILGEGTLSLYYTNSGGVKALQIRMGTSGNYGPAVEVTEDAENVVLFAPDLVGYIIVSVAFASLSSTSSRTETFTVTAPKGNMIPNYEGYETADGVGRTRHHLFAIRNRAEDPDRPISGMMLWTGKPAGDQTTCSSSYSVSTTAAQAINVANAATWPTRGFWVRNRTVNNGQGDLRYVDYRSGNTLYTKPVIWGRVDFKDGVREIKPGMTVASSQNTTYTAVVDQVILTGGSWEAGDATGTLVLKKWTVNFSFSTSYGIMLDGDRVATPSATSVRGYRGHNASTWSSGNILEPATDIDVGAETPDETGGFSVLETETVAPEGVGFLTCDEQQKALFAGPVYPGGVLGVWIRQTILDGTQAREDIEGDLNFEYY